ncbi:uroporphyrinogen-III synthase [Mangrovimonas spongiae]|uniref:Uroporphyrinogen-III synthase n=1 Tax=Mangrovimonas spongiae TaxID=2494697 RepID=A0A428K4T4_9FLAO|nr:uroporphyrinogen-III synthase [Mangrovimonas spongiae]RSK41444.1 uroporphyrinogen-III synthase [Mangrovimonas spongiae]
MTILSTKILTQEQKNVLTKANINVIDYNAITIDFLDFDDEIIAENAIITSKNAVKAVIDKKVVIKNCFCVGEKTKALLEENGQNVTKMTNYGTDLAKFIVKNHKNEHFWFFCNNIRRDELPNILTKNNISFKEVEVYKTALNKQLISKPFDAVLFFSPSGIESFTANNSLKNKAIFCIGKTTAKAAKPFAENIHIANKPTIESVLKSVVKQLTK